MVYSNVDENATLGVARSPNSSFQAKGPKVCGLSQVGSVFQAENFSQAQVSPVICAYLRSVSVSE